MSERRSGPESINAVTLATTDMERAVAFYEELGFVVASGGRDAAFTTFRVGPNALNLQLVSNARDVRGWGRVIFFVSGVDTVDETFERARAAGLEPSTRPKDASWGERYFHISDPDGHELSIAAPLVPA